MIREEILISNFTPSAAAVAKTTADAGTGTSLWKWFFIIAAIVLALWLVYKWMNPTPPAPVN